MIPFFPPGAASVNFVSVGAAFCVENVGKRRGKHQVQHRHIAVADQAHDVVDLRDVTAVVAGLADQEQSVAALRHFVEQLHAITRSVENDCAIVAGLQLLERCFGTAASPMKSWAASIPPQSKVTIATCESGAGRGRAPAWSSGLASGRTRATRGARS